MPACAVRQVYAQHRDQCECFFSLFEEAGKNGGEKRGGGGGNMPEKFLRGMMIAHTIAHFYIRLVLERFLR